MAILKSLLITAGSVLCVLCQGNVLAEDLVFDASVDYERDVKPILAARCYACHGALKAESSLRLDTVAAMRVGGDGGPVILPGDVSGSSLLQRTSDPDPASRMPPAEEGAPLTAEEIATLSAWIAAGAVPPEHDVGETDPREHWAFQRPVRPVVPEGDSWGEHPIDRFLGIARESRGLSCTEPVEPGLLLRRLTLDLIGLPPTLEELEAFESDPSEEHYIRIVDQLLDDPRYAERWGRHWMDVWRYSDWWGLGAEVRNSQKHLWHWRDWIIESLRDDVGYDEMLRLMLAADELAPTDPDRLRATGYLARQYFKFNRDTWLDETIEHTGKAFLGLTLNCSRCHDHKYDPLSSEEYYALRAFFEPYQVRMDVVPGQIDVESDGIPRVFDCHLDAPTYRYLRGDARQPVTDNPIAPRVPEILLIEPLVIEPVTLPPESHHPGLNPWVAAAHLERAAARIADARAELQRAQALLEEVRLRDASVAAALKVAGESGLSEESSWVVQDTFDTLRTELWEPLAGEWIAGEGRLEQRATLSERSILRLRMEPPADFEARFRFTILGGNMWRSVGVVFDSQAGFEQLAYLSAYAGGPKVQLAYDRGDGYQYPGDAARARAVPLHQSLLLQVRARGDLINVDVDGEPLLAWRTPAGRRQGAMELITFDAQAAFEEFELRPLPEGVSLRPAAGDPERPLTLPEAEAALVVAERKLLAAELVPATIEARLSADRARLATPPEEHLDQRLREAARAEKELDAAEADVQVATIVLERLRHRTLSAASEADDETLQEIERRLEQARTSAEQARTAIDDPGTNYTSLRGAFKSVESPTETPESLSAPFPAVSTGRRSALARWITDPRHPLTARVAVNHIWMRHFGAPLVPTVFDFGRRGQPPTHPELLDWLAVEFMEHGWSQKHLHRLMVTSAAYRMSSSSRGREESLERDPENHFLWRMNPRRMEAQVVRDSLLYLAGELDLTFGGPSIPLDQADQSRRRSLYFVHSHNDHQRFLAMFDDAGVQECYRREESIVPQQALALSNSLQAIESAQRIAGRLMTEDPDLQDEAFVRLAFRTVLAYDPGPEETQAALEAMQQWQLLDHESTSVTRTRERLIHALLNHNDFITIR